MIPPNVSEILMYADFSTRVWNLSRRNWIEIEKSRKREERWNWIFKRLEIKFNRYVARAYNYVDFDD